MAPIPSATEVFLPDRVALNTDLVYRTRTMTALLAGVAAGILGLTGLMGFVFFIIHAVLTGFSLQMVACRQRPEMYFAGGKAFLFSVSELTTGLLTFILVWTLVYDSIYIF